MVLHEVLDNINYIPDLPIIAHIKLDDNSIKYVIIIGRSHGIYYDNVSKRPMSCYYGEGGRIMNGEVIKLIQSSSRLLIDTILAGFTPDLSKFVHREINFSENSSNTEDIINKYGLT